LQSRTLLGQETLAVSLGAPEALAVGLLNTMESRVKNFINKLTANLQKPIYTPIGVYLLSFIIPAFTLSIPVLLFNWSADYTMSKTYIIGTIGQLLMDLPAVFMFYKLQTIPTNTIENTTRNRIISAIVGLLCALLLASIRFLAIGHLMGGRLFMGEVPAFTQSLALSSPWNIISAIMALLAYGPGEALFVVYLILAFDKVVGDPKNIFSWGVIITAVLWALPHLFNIYFYGLNAVPNVLIMFFIGLIMGILLKTTKSSFGPIIFWTLVNGTSA
jgi:hypothetical protein